MGSLIALLTGALDEEISIIEELLEICRTKTQLIVNSNVQELNGIIEKEHKIKLAMDKAERKRISAVAEITAFLNIDEQSTIADIISHIDGQHKADVQSRQQELKKLFAEYKQVNSLNVELIERHLGFIDYMVNTMAGSTADGAVYGVKGPGGEARKIYDYKA